MATAIKTYSSKDGLTTRTVFGTEDGFAFEVTHVGLPKKHIVCFSTQVGCAIGCTFCVSGIQGNKKRYVRNLAADEIIRSVNWISTRLLSAGEDKPVLYSAMGEGEPLLAYDEVVQSMSELGRRPNARLALSTSGAKADRISWLAREAWPVPLKLQLSIHSMCEQTRRKLMPGAGCLDEIVRRGEEYSRLTGFPVELNYVLLERVNDSIADAIALGELSARTGWLVKLNRFNYSPDVHHLPTNESAYWLFVKELGARGATVEPYITNGVDIRAACGQLSYSIRSDLLILESQEMRH